MDRTERTDDKSVKQVGPYTLGKTIGSGSTGKVKLGVHNGDGSKVAVKIIQKDALNLKPSMRRKIEREIAILKLIDHPHVLRLIDVYETDALLFIILDHVEGGELFDYLVGKGRLDAGEALFFFQQIISGLEYCQSLLICHRDLKPENLLLDANRMIKIADFGMASLNMEGSMLQTSCGSPHYACPQVVMGIKYNGMQADIWSCGVILYALVVGRLPFDDPNIKRLLAKVKTGIFAIPEEVDPHIRDLISKMIVLDPDQRITIEGIKRHPWFLSSTPKILASPSINQSIFQESLKYDNLDWEVITDLHTLGWGSEEEILTKLISPERTIEKVYYLLYEKKKKVMKAKPSSPPPRKSISIPNQGRPASRSFGDSPKAVSSSLDDGSASKPKSWFRNAFLRLTSKGDGSSPQHRGSCPDHEGDDSPGTISAIKPKESPEESMFDGTPRFFRKKFLPELPNSPVSGSTPKWSFFGFGADSKQPSIDALASSPPLSSSPVPTRKVSTSRSFGFVITKNYEDTVDVLFKALAELEIDCTTIDESNYHCRLKEYHSTLEFKVNIVNILDGTSHLVKFQRVSDDITAYDLTFDRIQRLMKGPPSLKDSY